MNNLFLIVITIEVRSQSINKQVTELPVGTVKVRREHQYRDSLMLIESCQARVLDDLLHVSILIAHFFFLPKRRLAPGIIMVCYILPPEITDKYKTK